MSRFTLFICIGALLVLSACNAPKTEAPAPGPEPVETAGQFDSDYDGVVDSADMCPHSPQGSDVDADGCTLYAEEYSNENGYPPPPPPPPPPTTSPGPDSPPPCLTNPVTFECIADLPAFP